MYALRSALIVSIFCALCACDSYETVDDLLQQPETLTLNPHQRTPLGAELVLITKEPTQLSITVRGEIPVKHDFEGFRNRHEVPVLGLYPDRENEVEVRLQLENGTAFSKVLSLQTEPLPSVFPEVEIVKLERDRMEEGFHLVDMLIANNGKFLSYYLLFDDNGEIRWFLDMSERGQITYSGDKNKNGNWLYLDWIDVFELDNLGKQVRRERLWNFAGNHYIEDVGGGKWLFGGSRKDAAIRNPKGQTVVTRFDHIVEWDYLNNRAANHWDLAENLDVDRGIYEADYTLDFEADWFHLNSILKTPDGDFLASGRNQGILKIDGQNKLQWILSPDYNWGLTGRTGEGFDPREYVLKALDAERRAPTPNRPARASRHRGF